MFVFFFKFDFNHSCLGWCKHALSTKTISFVYREQKEQLQKLKDFGSEPQMADHLPPPDSRLQNPSRPGMYPVWENVCSENEILFFFFLLCMFI